MQVSFLLLFVAVHMTYNCNSKDQHARWKMMISQQAVKEVCLVWLGSFHNNVYNVDG